jgi:hypothetical protein
MRYISLSKAQENLVTVRTVLVECTSVGMEHLYLVPGGTILLKTSLLTYILDGNIDKKYYIYIYIYIYIYTKKVF